MKEALFVLLDQYADWEAALVAAALGDAEGKLYCVKTVGLTKEPVRSIGGFTTLPDYSLDSAPEDFGALLLIGSRSWKKEGAKPVAALVKKAADKNALIGGICAGTAFLAMNGYLNDVRHTSNSLEYLKDSAKDVYTGEKYYIEQQAVSDKGIITANGTAYMEFAKEVLQALHAMPQQEIDEWYDNFKLGQYEADKIWGEQR